MKTLECKYAYPAGVERTEDMTPTGGCLRPPVGAFLGAMGGVWYYCKGHRTVVLELTTEYCDSREFPLQEVTADEAQVFEVMAS